MEFRETLAYQKSGLRSRRESIEREIEDLDPDFGLVYWTDPEEELHPDDMQEKQMAFDVDTIIGYIVYADVIISLFEEQLFEAALIRKPFRIGSIVAEFGNEARYNKLREFNVYGEYADGVKEIHDLRNDLVHDPARALALTTVGDVADLVEEAEEVIVGLEERHEVIQSEEPPW